MNKAKRIGVVLILLGLFIPSVLYPFTEPTPEVALLQLAAIHRGSPMYGIRLADLEVRLSGQSSLAVVHDEQKSEGRIAIPYKYVMAIGVVLVFAGAGIIALSSKRLKEEFKQQ